jgi:hypothetical protein
MTPSKRPGCFHDEFDWDFESTHSGGSSRENSRDRSYPVDDPVVFSNIHESSAASLPITPSFKVSNNVGHGLQDAEGWMSPGDVICYINEDETPQSSGLWRIGAAGGFSGHVIVIVRQPRRVYWGDQDAEYEDMWPRLGEIWPHDAEYVWRVGTIESTRRNDGLHDADMLFHVEASTGRLLLLAEINKDEVLLASREPAELLRKPEELQRGFRTDLMGEVLSDMKASEGNWSYATVALAFLSAGSRHVADSPGVLKKIQDSWEAEPICTSVVIAFWQRYLHKLAVALAPQADAAALIIDWMPLRADRTLPGVLRASMMEQGWESTRVPKYSMQLQLQRRRGGCLPH